MKKILLTLMITFTVIFLNAGLFNIGKFFRNNAGKKHYTKQKFEKAEKSFNENAIKDPTDPKLQYNLGNAYYKNSKTEEALSAYQSALRNSKFKDKDKVLHNIGNIYYNNEDYGQAIESYKQALKANPKNKDVKVNYELAKQMLQQQQQQQKQEQNKDEKKEEKQEKKEEQKQQKQSQEELDKQKEAEEQLKALQEQEQNDLKEKKKAKASGRAEGKYW